MADILLITGRPGVGKTTLIRRLAETLGDRAGGFYTEEIREAGERRCSSSGERPIPGRSDRVARRSRRRICVSRLQAGRGC